MNKTLKRFISKILVFCFLLSVSISNVTIGFSADDARQPTVPVTITVGKDKNRDFQSIQEALDSIKYKPTQGTRVTISIDEGTYEESIKIRNPYISFENSGKGEVLITYNKASENGASSNSLEAKESATVVIEKEAVGFIAYNITFQNSHNLDKIDLENDGTKKQVQAVALANSADKVIFQNCKFIGRQNTLYLNGASQTEEVYGKSNDSRAYLKDCYIEGTVDFIFGDATAVFDNCKLNMAYYKDGGNYTSASTTLFNIGYVFLNCELAIDKNYNNFSGEETKVIDLGRPLQSDNTYPNYGANTVFIKCKIPSYIKSEGWSALNENTSKNKIRYMEYNSTDENGRNIDLNNERPDWIIKLTQEQVQAYTIYNILRGTDGWNPSEDGKLSNPVKVAGITIDKYEIEIPEGEKASIKAVVLPLNSSNNAVTFSSSDENIVKVDDYGNITAIKSGKAQITATTNESKFSVSSDITVISNRTEIPQVKSIDIKNFKTEIGKIESIYPGDTLTGVYSYALATDDKIDNAKVKWYTVDSKTGEEILQQEGRESFNKEYKVNSSDIGNKIKFVVTPETTTNYGNYGTPVSCTTEFEVLKPDYPVPEVYLKESFSDFYGKKYKAANSNKYPTEIGAKPIWLGTDETSSSNGAWKVITLDGNDTIGNAYNSSKPSLLEYIPKEGNKPWSEVSLNMRMRFNPESEGFSENSYYDVYTLYNGKNSSYYKLRFTKGADSNSLKLHLYKKAGAASKEVLIVSEEEKFADIIPPASGEETPWFKLNISIKNGKITVSFTLEGGKTAPVTLTVADTEPIGSGYIAFESFGDKSALLLDSLYVEQVLSDAGDMSSVKVFIAGESEAAVYGEGKTAGGWGEYIQNYFDKNKVKIINKAEDGKSSRNFINQGKLNEILNEIKKGDYLFIQFGYNDSLETQNNVLENYVSLGTANSSGVYPVKNAEKIETPKELLEINNSMYKDKYYPSTSGTFKWYLQQYVNKALEKGAIPVLITPMSKIYFDDNGKIKSHYGENNAYITAMLQVAKEGSVKYIDMFEQTKNMHEKLGQSEAERMYNINENGTVDKTHYNKYGASVIAQMLAESIKKSDLEIGKYVNDVKNTVQKIENLRTSSLFIVGDSTACDYGEDLNYASPRSGWGTYIDSYLNKNITVKNLALSGRSSKSFTTEENYNTLLKTMQKGDYLFIQFGHNDSKNQQEEDKKLRYTEPLGSKETKGSFKYYLYNYYIKPSIEKGVNPVLISPVSRRNFDDTDKITDSHGVYDDAVRELASEINIPIIDMTYITEQYYNKLGKEQTKVLHALYKDPSKGENGIDNTHFNQYGASVIAVLIAQELKNTSCAIKNYIPDDAFTNVDGIYIKRADYIVMLMKVLGNAQKSHTNFNDVSPDKYYSEAIGTAKEIGVVNGDSNGNFKPEGYLSRQDMMVFTSRALKQIGKIDEADISVLDKFTDSKYIEDYAKQPIADLVQAGIISGIDGRLDPEITLTRVQAASMILKIYNK